MTDLQLLGYLVLIVALVLGGPWLVFRLFLARWARQEAARQRLRQAERLTYELQRAAPRPRWTAAKRGDGR